MLCLWIRNKVQPLKTKQKILECKFYDEETPEYNKNSTGNIIGLCGKYNILYVLVEFRLNAVCSTINRFN